MSDESPTNDPAPTPAAETPTPAAPAPAPETPTAPVAETPAAPVAETPAPVAPVAEAPAPEPATVADTQPEIPVVAAAPAAAGYAAPTAPAAAATATTAVPVAETEAKSGTHVAVPKWVLATVAGVLGAAVMFGIGYAVGDGSSSNDSNTAIGAPFGQNGQPPFGDQGGTGNQGGGTQGGGTQQVPSFPGQNGNGTGNQGGTGTPQAPSFPDQNGNGTGNQGGTGSQGDTGSPSTSGAFLGIATQQTTGGLEVVQVVSGSAADDAGLTAGDLIVAFDGNRVTTPAQLANAVGNLDSGDEVEITYQRDGSSRTVTVELGSRSTTNSN